VNKARLAKINELIRRQIAEMIERDFDHSPREFITVTEVITADDLLHTRIKVSIWPDEIRGALFERLVRAAGFFQGLLNKRLQMHPVPHISFERDDRVREAGRIEELLEKSHNN